MGLQMVAVRYVPAQRRFMLSSCNLEGLSALPNISTHFFKLRGVRTASVATPEVSSAMHTDWIIPDWPAPVGVRAAMTTRAGGVSTVPYDSLNLGSHVGDVLDAVQANRRLLQSAIGTRAVFMDQVHGAAVLPIDEATPDGQAADGSITMRRRLACAVMVADCLPVLLTTEAGDAVAAVHAGWRGLAGASNGAWPGVLESVFASFKALPYTGRAQSATKIIAWLGPCIGSGAFKVGVEVKAAFEAVQPESARFFVQVGAAKYLANLPALARLRLQSLGIHQIHGNDGTASWCTVSNPSRFFSHRRDAGITGNGFGATGRMAACIWLDD